MIIVTFGQLSLTYNNNIIMAFVDIDFEGNSSESQQTGTNENVNPANNQEDVTNLHGGDVDDINNKDENTTPPNNDSNKGDNEDETSSTGELKEGDQLEYDGQTYTVNSNGDIVDFKGVVFKEAKDVNDWLKSMEVDNGESDSTFDIASIQEALGLDITDEEGKPIEFTNDINGVKSLVESVIDIRSKELQEAAINRLYADNPLIKQFKDYVDLNGTPRGFGEIPDRSGIQLDKDNEAQLVAVIKMAASEFGNKSLDDNYIKYLRDSGSLYSVAKNQLAALVEKDNNYRKQIETAAQQKREQDAKESQNYWNSINGIISSRNIGGYKIPESFTKEIDGKKVILTPNDFFKYVSVPIQDENGRVATGYQRALDNLSDEDYMNREILDAWLLFTGGTYKDLIDMKVKEDEVRRLKIKSKEQRSNKTVKVIKPNNKKTSIDDILL